MGTPGGSRGGSGALDLISVTGKSNLIIVLADPICHFSAVKGAEIKCAFPGGGSQVDVCDALGNVSVQLVGQDSGGNGRVVTEWDPDLIQNQAGGDSSSPSPSDPNEI